MCRDRVDRRVHNLGVMARMLLNGESRFFSGCDVNGPRVRTPRGACTSPTRSCAGTPIAAAPRLPTPRPGRASRSSAWLRKSMIILSGATFTPLPHISACDMSNIVWTWAPTRLAKRCFDSISDFSTVVAGRGESTSAARRGNDCHLVTNTRSGAAWRGRNPAGPHGW